tara:strand:+ start:15982 stop:16839 length:858 start_codon:yes stop_codon:yes gene_type:complete
MPRSADLSNSDIDPVADRVCQPAGAVLHPYVEIGSTGNGAAIPLAAECALSLSYNGIAQAVMMVSPGDFDDFALGYSLSAGLIASASDLYSMDISGEGSRRHAALQISHRAFHALKQHRRAIAGTSGCGLCGVELMTQALPELEPMARVGLPPADHFDHVRERIAHFQALARISGAMHAALFVNAAGEIVQCREDIGRHNALDKLIGALHHQHIDCRQGFAVVTSRCSLELIQKAVRVRLATLVSLSAPTALSVEWASRYGLNLIHIPHHSAPRLYTPFPIRDNA